MNNDQKIQVAKDYVSHHKNDDPDLWMMNERKFGDEKLLSIYHHLMAGTFGEVRRLDYDFSSEYEIEISSHDSKTGNPVLFTWEEDIE
jgi:hypothetical protein